MRDKLFSQLLKTKTITLPEYARTYLGMRYAPSTEPMIISTLQMDDRFIVKDGRVSLTDDARKASFDTPLVILDVETTGLTNFDNYIVEIAAVKVRDGKIIDEFEALIKPPISINEEASKVSGITDQMLVDKQDFASVWQDFQSLLEDSIFVAHNAKFDWGFFQSELKRNKINPLTNRRMCSIELVKSVHPKLPTYKLEYLVNHFKTKVINTHRALDDVKATAEIVLQVLPKMTKGQLQKIIQ